MAIAIELEGIATVIPTPRLIRKIQKEWPEFEGCFLNITHDFVTKLKARVMVFAQDILPWSSASITLTILDDTVPRDFQSSGLSACLAPLVFDKLKVS